MTAIIQGERVALISMSPAFLRASLNGSIREAEQYIQLSLPSDWPGEHKDLLSLRLKQLEDDPSLQPWLVRAIALRNANVMIGHIGFHSGPGAECLQPCSPQAVEFGFTVYPPYRRQGYAREACVALMRWAIEDRGIKTFIMTIRPDNVPSQALAAS